MRRLPRLYAILDGGATRAAGLEVLAVAESLRDAGVMLLQYREKDAGPLELLRTARSVGEIFKGTGACLLLNDSPDLALAAGWDGVHVGQTDAAVEDARRIVGPDRIIGVSTHTAAQIAAAERTSADYVAVGPIFATGSKADAAEAVGLNGLRSLRALGQKPLVAIGGVTRETARDVFAAGADTVAVIGALLTPADSVKQNAQRLLQEVAFASIQDRAGHTQREQYPE